MNFSERERFIYHTTTLMTMSFLGKITKSDLTKKLEEVRNRRCKNLTDKQIEETFLDLEEEVQASMKDWNRYVYRARVWAEKKNAKFKDKQRALEQFHRLKKPGYKKREFSEDIQEDFK